MVIISKAMIKKLDELKAKENMDKNLDALSKELKNYAFNYCQKQHKKFMSYLVSESDKPNKNKRVILSDGISFGDSIKSKMN